MFKLEKELSNGTKDTPSRTVWEMDTSWREDRKRSFDEGKHRSWWTNESGTEDGYVHDSEDALAGASVLRPRGARWRWCPTQLWLLLPLASSLATTAPRKQTISLNLHPLPDTHLSSALLASLHGDRHDENQGHRRWGHHHFRFSFFLFVFSPFWSSRHAFSSWMALR